MGMAPELSTFERYESIVDLFPLGCIFGYMLSDGGKHPFGEKPFERQNRIQLNKPMLLTIADLKEPYRKNSIGIKLIQSMVQNNPVDRPTALEILNSDFFGQEFGVNMLTPGVLNQSSTIIFTHQSPISTRISIQQVHPLQSPSENEKFDSV